MRRRGRWGPLGAAFVLAACAPAPAAGQIPVEAAHTELRELITDVTAATAYRYGSSDDLGRPMGPVKIIWIPEAERFAAVYFVWTDEDRAFHVELGTSADLLDWTWQVELASQASQPTIAAASDGGYVVAWEQEPDPIHNVVEFFATWDDLRAGLATRHFDVPITIQACGEGTPSIGAASSLRVDLSFHYHADCERDRQAEGTTDWTTWRATAQPNLDRALIELGVRGHIGDRDRITFRGHALTLVEGQLVLDDWSSWRTFLYDAESGSAEQLRFRTHAGSLSVGNPSISRIEIDGSQAILVTLFVFSEGSKGAEEGSLIFYRTLQNPE
jgi:hypothetical protein